VTPPPRPAAEGKDAAAALERLLTNPPIVAPLAAPNGSDPRADEDGFEPDPFASDWPDALGEAAFRGLAGEFVALVGPHTEADPAALLIQLLVGFGNVVGRGPHVLVGADRHGVNLSAVVVGATSRGRKGTAEAWTRALLRRVDERWANYRVQTGLTSGEGLINAVRDASKKLDKDGNEVVADPGEDDKRLIAIEPEFARVLRAASRESNTLSAQLRMAWDAPEVMRTMTRNSPLAATRAHISVVGHVTSPELRKELTEVETANGFANRFLWAAARRSKLLPRGGDLVPDDLTPLAQRFSAAASWAATRGEISRDGGFWTLWDQVYPELTSDRPGLLGAVTSRCEAQVLRLALAYALLDSSELVQRPHLEAALAVWRYCEASAAHVFGTSLGDPLADRILAFLRHHGGEWVARNDVRVHLSGHPKKEELNRAFAILLQHGLAETEKVPTKGAPRECWRSTLDVAR
jgi:hypothetical protein